MSPNSKRIQVRLGLKENNNIIDDSAHFLFYSSEMFQEDQSVGNKHFIESDIIVVTYLRLTHSLAFIIR